MAAAAASDAERKKAEAEMAAIKSAFEQGVALSNEGKYDEAIAKFNEVLGKVPKCAECYTNIGAVYMKKKDYDKAEAAYKKAIELNPNSAEAYNGLANVYNAQKKFDQAAEAGAQAQKLLAAGRRRCRRRRRNASATFNQGVIPWNAGKIPEAKKLFEQAVAADPKMAEAHYWLGMANVNQGKLPEAAKSFEEYLKLDADRPVRRAGEGDPRVDQEVAVQVPGSAEPSNLDCNVHRRQPRGRPRPDCCGGASVRTSSASGRHARRRLEDVQRRPRPRGVGRRPARLRREQGAGSPAEDRRHGRYSGKVASHRPPAVEQGEEGGAGVRVHPVGRFASICCSGWTMRQPAEARGRGPLEVLVQVDLAGEATKFGAPPDEAERHRAGRRRQPRASGWPG